jgi:hypothetical protein
LWSWSWPAWLSGAWVGGGDGGLREGWCDAWSWPPL